VIEGGEIGIEGSRGKFKKARGLGKGLGYWPALRAAWEFIGRFRSNRVLHRNQLSSRDLGIDG
jgi:hypothetical protein